VEVGAGAVDDEERREAKGSTVEEEEEAEDMDAKEAKGSLPALAVGAGAAAAGWPKDANGSAAGAVDAAGVDEDMRFAKGSLLRDELFVAAPLLAKAAKGSTAVDAGAAAAARFGVVVAAALAFADRAAVDDFGGGGRPRPPPALALAARFEEPVLPAMLMVILPVRERSSALSSPFAASSAAAFARPTDFR
jgi:hypothetical protein